MNNLLEYMDYASLMTPKKVSNEIQLISRRFQYLAAINSDYDKDIQDIIQNLQDVNSVDKIVYQLMLIHSREDQ
jgi:hypothetical protein